jgi:tetratricopeptide (TPR) repeat protein
LWEHLVTKTNRLYKRGQYLEAVDVAKDALKVAEETFGSEHPNMVLSLSNLAILYHEQGKYVEAELLYKRALAISEKVLGKDHRKKDSFKIPVMIFGYCTYIKYKEIK